MARYTGAVCKHCRREMEKLFLKGERCLTDKCGVERRGYPPGEHGRKRPRESEYLIQLRAKQKAKRIYGILEKQFKNYYQIAAKRKGITGEMLLRLLETRLDNVVYRLGFAASRKEARQLVRHGHFSVNDRRTNIPSFRVKPDNLISLSEKGKKVARIKENTESVSKTQLPDWLEVDYEKMTGKVISFPERDQIDTSIQEQLIVELYSK
jgi:small subunit ribosomal protein S4